MTFARTLAAAALLAAAIAWAPARADEFNPQPEPPGVVQRLQLADGRTAYLTRQSKLEIYNASNALVSLPPGPCRLASGATLHVLADGSVAKADLLTLKGPKNGRPPQ